MDEDKKSMPFDYIENALRVAEQGLKSMQALQLKTTEAHQKFLETQAEAGRALKEMFAEAQRMSAGLQSGILSVPTPSHWDRTVTTPPPHGSTRTI